MRVNSSLGNSSFDKRKEWIPHWYYEVKVLYFTTTVVVLKKSRKSHHADVDGSQNIGLSFKRAPVSDFYSYKIVAQKRLCSSLRRARSAVKAAIFAFSSA
jgi:hypothetical protein